MDSYTQKEYKDHISDANRYNKSVLSLSSTNRDNKSVLPSINRDNKSVLPFSDANGDNESMLQEKLNEKRTVETYLKLLNNNYEFYATIKNKQKDIQVHVFEYDFSGANDADSSDSDVDFTEIFNKYYYVNIIEETGFNQYVLSEQVFKIFFGIMFKSLESIVIKNENPIKDIEAFLSKFLQRQKINVVPEECFTQR
jgi:hypothetical protein